MTQPFLLPYRDWRSETGRVSGNVQVFPNLHSPQLGNERPVVVYLPPSYDRKPRRRFPVLYMHDGQNLFDAATSYVGVEWGVDECMEALATEGYEAIAVGIWNTQNRQHEYTPFSTGWRARGDAYLDFVLRTVKPLIDGVFRTDKSRAATGMIGSSLGGLISTYAYFKHPRKIGFFGALSPAYWAGDGAIYEMVKRAAAPAGRIYLDNGAHENSARRMYNFLSTLKGYQPERDLVWIEDPIGQHDEHSWARRLPDALRFLLAPFRRKR